MIILDENIIKFTATGKVITVAYHPGTTEWFKIVSSSSLVTPSPSAHILPPDMAFESLVDSFEQLGVASRTDPAIKVASHGRGFTPSEKAELPFLKAFFKCIEEQFKDPAGPEGIRGHIGQFRLKWPEATDIALLIPSKNPLFKHSIGKGFAQLLSNYDILDVQRTASVM